MSRRAAMGNSATRITSASLHVPQCTTYILGNTATRITSKSLTY